MVEDIIIHINKKSPRKRVEFFSALEILKLDPHVKSVTKKVNTPLTKLPKMFPQLFSQIIPHSDEGPANTPVNTSASC